MKLRYLTTIFTICIAILITVNLIQIKSGANNSVDMASLNENYKKITKNLNHGYDREELEEIYKCQIYLKSDSDYMSQVMDAIKQSKVIMDYENGSILLGKIVFSGKKDFFNQMWLSLQFGMIKTSISMLLIGYLILGLTNYFYVRPFKKLQKFAANIAKGNLEAPLFIYKRNYFGVFTESFDIMREELKAARENEYKANISKKELVAELSHDIKTPIATIKATCEVLKMKALKNENSAEVRDVVEKAGVIEQKADMIDQLISNLFHATLEELENLKVEASEESSIIILDMFEELRYYGNIQIINPIPGCLIYIDKLRLNQVIDNIINNSYKYAGTGIQISFQEQTEGIVVEIRDFGEGVLEEELPLITEKFFRGTNGKGKSGTGLGLFLAKYFMENMKGSLECYNNNGFVVRLFLRRV